MERLQLLENWIGKQFPGESFALSPASADASFRRYFRATFPHRTLIAMDAPPGQEDCIPFLKVAGLFAAAGVHVPTVVAQDLARGFLLLSDLGDTTYLRALDEDPGSADRLYRDAWTTLIDIQRASRPGVLPAYDEALLRRELNLFPQWYLAQHRRMPLDAARKAGLEAVFDRLVRNALAQPCVFVHRDYHARNLMVSAPNPGVIDFQDAVYGPVTYDLVSLFRDAYVRWDEERVLDWVVRYWESARRAQLPVTADFAEFYRDFEWMGVQRHLKVLGIFARLWHRDAKAGYLEDMPRVMRYLRQACARYRELDFLHALLEKLDEVSSGTRIGYTF